MAHLAAGVVVRRRATYDEARGSPEQWVSGIVRLEVLNYRGTLGRPPGPVLRLDPGRELPSDTTPQDVAVSDRELLAYLLTRIPRRQARVVRLYELGSLTYREVGALELLFPGDGAVTAVQLYETDLAAMALNALARDGLEQIVDRLGKNSRRRRGDARHLVASYQQMTEAALMARLDESTVGCPSVTHQKPLVMVAQDYHRLLVSATR